MPHYHFVTGKLAADALRSVVHKIAENAGFSYSIGVMPITVAALITPRWLMRHLQVPHNATEVILPGYCTEGLAALQAQVPIKVSCGPRDLRDLPQYFGKKNFFAEEYGKYSIEIVAEINHAPRMSLSSIVNQAQQLAAEGADVIDIGCDPASRWSQVADAVRAVRDLGLRVSIDTFDAYEAEQACRAGAELVLSVNSSNREAAKDWGAEVVVIPDTPDDLPSLDASIDYLQKHNVPCRADPILEPIGLGFTNSLARYVDVRQRYPELPMLMGIGNLTELTDVDSAGVNVLLISICAELKIHSVLTTQVINWARSSVRECDIARRMAEYAVVHRTPPKNIDDRLVRLRDPRLKAFDPSLFTQLATAIRDHNYRIFAQDGEVHLVSAGIHLSDRDPFELFAKLSTMPAAEKLDTSHAFYLGFEMAKALTALTLGKHYEQDEALRWGDLTRPEKHHRLSPHAK